LEDGADQAIVGLSGGDMRKVLNILESCSLGYQRVSKQKVFEVTGRPSEEDVRAIYQSLTSQPFKKAFDEISRIRTEKSLSMDDIVREVHQQVMATKMPDLMKMTIVQRLCEVEFRLAQGSSEKAQLSAVVGVFIEVRSIVH
jgi:replication factor C subunit 3/5